MLLPALPPSLLHPADAPAWAVPTFECLGLYYSRAEAAQGCRVRYRAAGEGRWREGYPFMTGAKASTAGRW